MIKESLVPQGRKRNKSVCITMVVVGEGEQVMKNLWAPIVGVALLISLSAESRAHHKVGHNEFKIGEQTQINLKLGACDTLDKANTIMVAHVESGFLVATKIMRSYMRVINQFNEPACGFYNGRITVQEVIRIDTVDFREKKGVAVTTVRFISQNGREYYGFLTNSEVLKGTPI